jgi:MinD-like ATPase involved in chromosome partitioning or flagellar assembly
VLHLQFFLTEAQFLRDFGKLMSQIISVHSFRRGAGKSSLAANIAALMALSGLRVGVVDADTHTPTIHMLLGLDEGHIQYLLADVLSGKCAIEQAAYEVTSGLGAGVKGRLYVVPASAPIGDRENRSRDRHDVELLNAGFQRLIDKLALDALLIDNGAGLSEETLPSIAIADVALIILRHDNREYQGTSVFVEITHKLDVERVLLIVNEVPQVFDFDDVCQQVQQAYQSEVAGVLPYAEEMNTLRSAELFVLRYPEHVITAKLKRAVTMLT